MSILSHSLESLLPFSLTKKKKTKSEIELKVYKKSQWSFLLYQTNCNKEDDDYDGLTAITKAIEKNESMAFVKD